VSHIIHSYVNGNYTVDLYSDGTKVRVCDDPNFVSDRPESIDIKITNNCSFGVKNNGAVISKVCGFCHEMSHNKGRHADLSKVLDAIGGGDNTGMEIAVGGGNALSHPDIVDFMRTAKGLGIVPNITHNQLHLKENEDTLNELMNGGHFYGLGISYRGFVTDSLIKVSEYDNFVLHVIAGIDDPLDVLNTIKKLNVKNVLVLGYKDFGNGKKYNNPTVEQNLNKWFFGIGDFCKQVIDLGGVVLFDNIANDRLNISRLFIDKSSYRMYYNGDDGTHTFYIDAVNEVYAKNSTSTDRHPFNNQGVVSMFNHINSKLL